MLVRTRDIDTAFYEMGRGTPLLLVHGLADDHRLWRKVLPRLIVSHRVIAYDIRGHGATDAGRGDGTLQQLGDDLVALLDAIGLERAAIAGYSLGGTIAMRVAIDHPDRVTTIFPIATSSRIGKAALGWYLERAEREELRTTIEQDTVEQYHLLPSELEEVIELRREATEDFTGYRNACLAMARLNQEPLDPELGRIQAPTLVISADLDQNCPPRAGEAIAGAIPGARFEIIQGSGHPIPVFKPDELAGLIETFLLEAALA